MYLKLIRKKKCSHCGHEIWTAYYTKQTYCPNCDNRVQYYLKNSGIPPNYSTKGLSDMFVNLHNRKLISHIKDVFAVPKRVFRWVALTGRTGTGKTEFACILLRGLMRRLIPTRYIHMPTFLDTCRLGQNFNDPEKAEEFQEELSKALSPYPVCLDDFYADRYSPFEMRCIYRIIHERDAKNFPTIITTQHHYDELEERLGETISSRIRGRAKWFMPGKENMRTEPE